MVAMEVIVTMATERVINFPQYKAAPVAYLIMDISTILRPRKLKLGIKMHLHPSSQLL